MILLTRGTESFWAKPKVSRFSLLHQAGNNKLEGNTLVLNNGEHQLVQIKPISKLLMRVFEWSPLKIMVFGTRIKNFIFKINQIR